MEIAKLGERHTFGGSSPKTQNSLSADTKCQTVTECGRMLIGHWDDAGHPLERGESMRIWDARRVRRSASRYLSRPQRANDRTFKRRTGTISLRHTPERGNVLMAVP